mmetsp:Transcript_711/g.1520  ORF Transcript_711/g.1520 Transcript_711/m.1520 type:complete len:185 (-) Transcript_711:408-962(-)
MASQRSNVASSAASNSLSNFNGNRAAPLSPPISPTPQTPATAQFNPRLILSQIISLQSFHYVVLGVIFQINHVLFATSITMDRIFTAKFLDIWSAMGWIDNAAVLTSSFIGSLLLALIVEKSKKCLDFSVTLFLIHIILSSMYGGFPSTWDWWIIHILGMIMMVVLGEYFCSKRELSDIPLLVL